MRTTTKFGFMFAGILATSPICVGQESLEDVIERVEKSVIRIEVEGARGPSLGSGFVVDNRGTIITNCHVLAGARRAIAFFPNGKQCEISGTMLIDETRDIVVGRITLQDAPPIEIAPGLPRKGERVVALGAPLGLAFSATNGIVSAIRSATEMRSDVNRADVDGTWIQVDAPLSPGNSGGPLINAAGKLVGMSTLASAGGRAQNLNFGISANDISSAIKYANGVVPVPLPAGVGKINMEESESGPGNKRGPGESGIARGKIPPESLARFVNVGIRDFDKLLSGLRAEKTRLSADLTQMKGGRSFIPPQFGEQDAAVVKAKMPGSKTPTWFFDSEETKREVIDRQQQRIRRSNELSTTVKGKDDQKSVFDLLINFGPPLDAKKDQSVGFARDIIVLHAFNKHDVIVVWDENPYLLYAESTAGLHAGEIMSVPVMVSGTEVLVNSKRPGLTTSLTVLQMVPEDDIKQAVQSRLGFRTWRSGQHSVEAKLVSYDDDKVVLKKRDGSTVEVPRSKIHPDDLAGLD